MIALFVSFCGLRFVAWLERLTWAAVLLAFVVALGVGGKHLADPSAPGPTDARAVLSFASVIAGFIVTYAPMASDYTLYLLPSTPSWKLFAYSYAGFAPIIPLQCLGAAAVLSAPLVPGWDVAYGTGGDVGALVLAMLGPVGGFGRFLTVLLALSVAADIAPDVYSAALSLQVLVPGAGALPRPVFALVAFAVILPVAIVGQTRFYDTLNNFLAHVVLLVRCAPFR
jgi:purine-cytosine permease-like protein